MQLPSRRQILAKLEAEKQELADMKKDPIAFDPDAESLARLKALKGEPQKPAKPQLRVRTAQVCCAAICVLLHICFYAQPSRNLRRGSSVDSILMCNDDQFSVVYHLPGENVHLAKYR